MSEPTETTFDRASASRILEARTATLQAIPPEAVRPIRVGRQDAAALSHDLVRRFTPLVPVMRATLSPAVAAEREAQLADLEDAAMAYTMASLRAEAPWTPAELTRRAEVDAAVREADAFLTEWAGPTFAKQPRVAEELADIRKGSSLRDSAEDVLRLVVIFREHWPLIDGRTFVTRELLDTAEADATESLRLMARTQVSENEAADLARRAYTAWAVAYEELMHLGRYLMRHDADAAKHFPGIGGRPKPKPRKPRATPAAPTATSEPDTVA